MKIFKVHSISVKEDDWKVPDLDLIPGTTWLPEHHGILLWKLLRTSKCGPGDPLTLPTEPG